jgi:guanosine-diphosphatase
MMDAGSTGSRTHVFEFNYDADGKVELSTEVFEELKPGLSSFANDPTAAANSLIPLMDAAVKVVPADVTHCTPVMLKATAGLRLIGAEKSEAILKAVSELFAKYPFFVPDNAAVVMDGKDEGPYAWLTVNFLLGALGPKGGRTAAILDMGGASTQIVFVPDSPDILDTAPVSHVFDVKLPAGRSFRTYTTSHLGLGLKEAGKSILKLVPTEKNPCVADTSKPGTTNFHLCLQHAQTILRKDKPCTRSPCSFGGVYQPPLQRTFSGEIYAFSYFYDRMEKFLSPEGNTTVGEYRRIGEKICDGAEDPFASYNKGTMCMDFTYLYALLTTGYDLTDHTPLMIKKKIKNVETAWALGAMILNMP